MASLDVAQQTAEEVLLGELDYALPPTSSYIVDRRVSSFFTSSAGTFSDRGVRTFRIQVSDDLSWADLSTLTVSFTIKNTSPQADSAANVYRLRSKTDGPWSLIHRMRVFASGTPVEDLQYYNRLHEQFYRLMPKDVKMVQGASGFIFAGDDGGQLQRGYIANGDTHTVAFQPLCGIRSTGKFWPAQWVPLVFEFELADAATCWESGVTGAGPALNYITSYEISDARINVDLVTLDTAMNDNFAKLMESGKSLPLQITSFAHFNQALVGESPVVSLTRAASRIRDVMWSFTRVPGAGYAATWSHVNDFFHPRADLATEGGARLTDVSNYETQWSLGGKLLGPEQRFRFTHQYLHEMYKSFGIHNARTGLPDIDLQSFKTLTHVPCVSLERAINVAMTGLSSRSGSLLSVQFRGLNLPAYNGGAAVDQTVSQVWIVMMFEASLQLSKYGTTVAE